MASSTETFQLSVEAAEIYESKYVPNFFGEWAPQLVDLAGVAPGQAVLDVACGTGIVARTAAERVGTSGHVAGVDINEAMLTVARRIAPGIEWRRADAAELPFPDDSYDAVLCSFALMFFPDPVRSLREMARVAKPGGTVAVQVPGPLQSAAGYAEFVEVAARHAGPEAISLLSSYFTLGDRDQLEGLFEAAGLRVTVARTRTGGYRGESIDDVVADEVYGTPLGERITDEVYDDILRDSRVALRPYLTTDGQVETRFQGHLVAARKRR